jgi:hypothetical protein
LIGQPNKRLIQEEQTGKLNIRLGRNFKLSIPITHSLNAETEPIPEEDPMEEVKVASLDYLIESNLKDDALFFIEEEDKNPIDLEPLDELLELPMLSIELKPWSAGLRYAFLNNNQDSPIIISDKLSQEESLCLLTILEKHHSGFGYSLQDLKGISPALYTHRIPTDLDSIPSRESQCGLNNAMRGVIKKEILKLLHAKIIYLVPHSEWVSPTQVVPKKRGMTVVENGNNELIPQRTLTGW